jgi:aspartyl/asparaginyl-tRNA synthetase
MTDEELVKRLRNFDDGATPTHEAADRIEALLNLNEALVELMDDRDAKLAKAVELLKEARQDLEAYVTHEWPKDEHPYYDKKWERDMELCRRIDTTLAEIDGEKG